MCGNNNRGEASGCGPQNCGPENCGPQGQGGCGEAGCQLPYAHSVKDHKAAEKKEKKELRTHKA